jgi:serine/arginine repetitive matrix protein 2
MPRSSRASDDLYDDPRDDRYASGRDDRRSSYAESSVSTTRGDKDKKKARDKDRDKDRKVEKRRSTRSVRSGSLSQSQTGGYRGDIVESPKQPTRSFSGQIGSEGFSQFPGQAGAPLMSGALPSPHYPLQPGMSSHVQDQFPGQDPAHYASSALPGGNPFGAAAEFYQDMGQSVGQQPGVRPQQPSVIIGQDTPHLTAAAAQPNPVADTGSGAAADFYGGSTNTPSSKPPRPSSMPGAFFDDEPAPTKPPRPSSKPSKPNKPAKLGSAATLAGGAALGYAMGHSSNNTHQSTNYSSSSNYQSTSYTNGTGTSNHSSNMYTQSGNPSYITTESSNHIPTYSQATEGAPPPKPPRPGKPEKHSSGSNAGLYAAGAAGLAAYGLHHQHDSHSASHNHTHNHTSTNSGAFSGHNHNNGLSHSPSAHMNGGMAQRHQHTGPVSRFVDWWKDYEDVQKMEEYTEYIGVCKYCFDPRSSVTDAPRKHYYGRRRSSEYMRPSGGIEKQSRYTLKEKKSHSSFSSGDERRKKHNSSAAGWVAAGLGGIGLAKAGKAVLSSRRDDFDDTYSIKSGRSEHDSRSRISGRSRSRSRDYKAYSYGQGEVRRSSRSRDRMSQLSVGVTSDKKDHKVIRRHSRSRSRSSSSSRDGKSGFGTALGVGLAGAALGAAVSKSRKGRSRSRSPKKTLVHHRRDSSDDERRRKSQQLRRKASKSSTSGASVIDISHNNASQSGFFSGFFAAPGPKIRRKRSITPSYKKKKKGFFSFGNASSSSSDSEMAFGTGYVARRRRSSPKRRNSDERFPLTPKRKVSQERSKKIAPKRKTSEERLRATLAGLGATAAAIAAAKAARSSGKHHGDVVAVKQHRRQRKSSDRPRPGSRYGDDEWEDLPDDDTSESSSDAGLVYGDFDWRKSKSTESLASNGSGTNKWGWRWGFGQKKRRSSENLYDNIATTSFIGPATAGAAGAITGAVVESKLGRHDSESSSVQTLQSVYPVASNDPTRFDARRTSLTQKPQTPQPLITSGPSAISIHQPQPVHQVPGAIYSTQAPSQSSYTAPSGPPVFSQVFGPGPYQTQHQTQNIIVQAAQPSIHAPILRRANSSPIQTSNWKRDVAIAGIAATAGAAAIAAAKGHDRRTSSPSNVRFNLTKEQSDKDQRERRSEQDRRDEEDRRHQEQLRKDEVARRDEEDRRRREQQLHDDETRRHEEERRQEQLRRDDEAHREEERRRSELIRQQEEARRYMEAERLAKVEVERRADERLRQQEQVRAREAREAEEQDRREREARTEALRRADQEADAEQMRRERHETEQREFDRAEAKKRNDLIRQDLERRRIEREAQESTSRYGSDREQQKLEYQRTGSSVSSVATDVRRKEKELEEREREVVKPDTRKSTVASAVAAGAAAAITSAAISSYKDKEKEKKEKKKDKVRERESKRDSSPTVRNATPSSSKTYESSEASTVRPSTTKSFEPTIKTYEPSETSTIKHGKTKAIEPSGVVTYAPSNLQQDYVDEDIFDPNLFKKQTSGPSSFKKQTAIGVLEDWEDRYNTPAVTQAEFFAPKELLQNDNLPKVRPVDPNEGAPNITMSEAHDHAAASHAMTPPYPAAYAFVATRDGRPSLQQSWPVPSLNLIAPTPPGSRAPSVQGASAPPSPAMEPVKEPVKVTRRVPKPEDANKARSRVSWGENQFHHFEVTTPDSYREQFVSNNDLEGQSKSYSNGDVPAESESSTTYKPYRPGQGSNASELPEIAPSTQYIRDEKDSDWDTIVDASSKKSSKREQKKAAAAAVAAAAAAAAASAADWDDDRHDNMSVISNPFSDTHAAASTIAGSTVGPSVLTSSTIRQSPAYQDYSTRTAAARSPAGPGFVEGEITTKPFTLHMPGGFDEPTTSDKDDDEPAEKDLDATSKSSKKGKKKSRSTDDIVVAQDTPRRAVAESISEREPVKEVAPEPEAPLSKKEKKKKSKSKRMSVDSWEESDVGSLPSPTMTRDIRDMEPPTASKSTHEPSVAKNTSQSESNGNNVAAAAMAGGFAALIGTAMKQDQDRIASDFEHARQSFQSAEKHDSQRTSSSSSSPTRHRTSDSVERSGSTYDEDDLIEAKTPRGKKNKRHSSGRWSPTIGSPLRTETKYEDYIGAPTNYDHQSLVEAPKVSTESALTNAPKGFSSRNVHDSGYHAPDDVPRREPADRDSDEFFSAGSDERERSRNKAQVSDVPNHQRVPSPSKSEEDDKSTVVTVVPSRNKYDDDMQSAESSRAEQDDDTSTIVTAVQSPGRYDDDRRPAGSSRTRPEDDSDHEDGHRHGRDSRSESRDQSREQSRDRTYGHDDGGERRRRHRRRETDDPNDDWDTRSTISEARSEATSERRRKHRRKESERDVSPESMIRSRSSAASEPGDVQDERKSSRRKSRRDDDDNASVISTSSRHDDERSSKKEKEKEKRPSGLFGLFSSKSKENLAETYNKSSSKPREEDEEEEGKRRRRKHRSDRGSTYGGSDDDDNRSTISSSSRREKRSSRSERGEGDRRDSYDEKVHRSSYVR